MLAHDAGAVGRFHIPGAADDDFLLFCLKHHQQHAVPVLVFKLKFNAAAFCFNGPVDDLLACPLLRCQPHLLHAVGHRIVVGVAGGVGDGEEHGAIQ